MTNILVPTDFTPKSVQLAEQAIRASNQKVNIHLFHAFRQPFFYNELIRDVQPHAMLVTDAFRNACRRLKEMFPEQVNSIRFAIMRGDTQALFRNLADAHEIDLIFCPDSYYYRPIHQDSVSPLNFFKRSRIPLMDATVPGRIRMLRGRNESFITSVS